MPRLLPILLIALALAGCRNDPRVEVHRPPEEVYRLLTDLTRYPDFAPAHFTRAHTVFAAPDSTPVFRFILDVAGAPAAQALVVERTVPGREIVLASPPGTSFPMRLIWTLAPYRDRTELGARFEYDSDQPLLAQAVMGPDLDTAARQMLVRVRAIAEGR